MIGTHPKQRDQIEKKEEMEVNLELTLKSVSNLRAKLKELSK
jgi:hypothetical protein